MGTAGFWRLDAAAGLSDWAHQHHYESRKWWARCRIPGPGCLADGYKMMLCLCPAKVAHNCCPIRSLLAGGPRNSNLCPQQSRKIVAAFRGMHVSPAKHSFGKCDRKVWQTDRQTDRHTDGRRTKWSLCVAMLRRRHKNCPCRGPRNSNLCIQQSRKNIHCVDPDDKRSKHQIAMCLTLTPIQQFKVSQRFT